MYSVPIRLPVRVGLNVTDTEQIAPGPNSVPQVVVREKSPEMLILEILIFVVPKFLTITLSASLSYPT